MKCPLQLRVNPGIATISFGICALLLCVSANARAENFTYSSDTPLIFSVVPAKQTFDTGEDVTVRFVLTNTSPQSLTVNARFLVNYHHYSEQEIVVHLRGPDGQPLTFIPAITAGMPNTDYFISLAPGASTAKNYNLSRDFAVSMIGTYRIKASYTNRYEPGWFGAIASEENVFSIK